MYVNVSTAEIAQRLGNALLFRFKHKPHMTSVPQSLPRYSQAQFKGHIETGCPRCLLIQLYARQVVDGELAAADKSHNSV